MKQLVFTWILFLVLLFAAFIHRAQTQGDTLRYRDSINYSYHVVYRNYLETGGPWERTRVHRIYSKDSLLLYEHLQKIKSKGGCIADTELDIITMYDDNRHYRTRELKSAGKYLIKRYNASGELLSKEKVKQRDLKNEWDEQIYSGKYEQAKARSKKRK
jgi:hypothetical protein